MAAMFSNQAVKCRGFWLTSQFESSLNSAKVELNCRQKKSGHPKMPAFWYDRGSNLEPLNDT